MRHGQRGMETLPVIIYPPVGEPIETVHKASAHDYEMMGLALDEATKALELGNHPVGAVLTNAQGDVWVAHADEHSSRRLNGHAERNVIEKYNRETGELALRSLAMYVNVVPCVGCAYAIDQGELGMLFYGADRNEINEAVRASGGEAGVRQRLLNMPDIFHESPRNLVVVSGLMKAASAELYVRKYWQEQENFQDIISDRRKGY